MVEGEKSMSLKEMFLANWNKKYTDDVFFHETVEGT